MKNTLFTLVILLSASLAHSQESAEVKHYKTVVMESGTVSYYTILSDNTIWYANSGDPFKKSGSSGLPD